MRLVFLCGLVHAALGAKVKSHPPSASVGACRGASLGTSSAPPSSSAITLQTAEGSLQAYSLANYSNAICLDGTPATYFLRRNIATAKV